MSDAGLESRNRRTSWRLLLVVGGMFGFGYAMVPLYDVFCEIAGINGKGIRTAENSEVSTEVDRSRTVKVEFTGSIMGGLPWDFKPAERVEVHPGEVVRIVYTARNLADTDVTGQAVPSITPNRATRHFIKTECFCFNNQVLAAGEVKEMPLIFRVDPDLPEGVKTITLSYAFYRAKQDDSTAAVDLPIVGAKSKTI